jgi:hypothetical protein
MDEQEGARRELIQHTRNTMKSARANADISRRTAAAYRARQPGVRALPVELLRDYADALREEAAAGLALAEAVEGEIAAR